MKQYEQKNHYVLKIIHDFKIPTLAQIVALESFLKTSCTKLNEEENNLILLTLNSCNHVENLIEIYSTLEKLNQNSIQLTYEKFDVSKIIEEQLIKENILIKFRELRINLNFKNKIILNADKNLFKKALESIILSCLNNAFKKSLLEFNIQKTKENLLFEIIYFGNSAEFETITKIFKKNPDKYSQEFNYNIGLHLANKIILSHFGIMKIESYANNKNLVSFKIPL